MRKREKFFIQHKHVKVEFVTQNYYISSFLLIRILGLVGKRIERISHKKLLLIMTKGSSNNSFYESFYGELKILSNFFDSFLIPHKTFSEMVY